MALGSTQPLTEMITRNISWEVKAPVVYSWQLYHLHVPIVLKSGNLNLVEPSGPVQACNGIYLPLPLHIIFIFYKHNSFNTTYGMSFVYFEIIPNTLTI